MKEFSARDAREPRSKSHDDRPTTNHDLASSRCYRTLPGPHRATSCCDPTTSDHDPTTSDHDPTTSNHDPTASCHDPTTTDHDPTTSEQLAELRERKAAILALKIEDKLWRVRFSPRPPFADTTTTITTRARTLQHVSSRWERLIGHFSH